jgi:hypothetical protein
MPDPISPEALPGWPLYKDFKAEEATLLACLLGRHGKVPLTGPFGHAMAFWEVLRHGKKLVELLTKLRRAPDNDQWRHDPDFSTLFPDQTGFIVSTPGFLDTPFLSLKAELQKELIERFTPGQPALEVGSIVKLEASGTLKRFEQLAKEARKTHQFGERFTEQAILKRERLNRGELVYDAIFVIRAQMGVTAVLKDFEQWLKDNRKLFTKTDAIALRRWEDPRPVLRDLAVLRLVRLYGYDQAQEWTRKHRPRKGIGVLKSDYDSYFGEEKKKGNRPLYERRREFENAVRRALDAIASLMPM